VPIDASLWDIVPKVARRSLDLGLSMPESGFHIFVAADPEVMIEDVVVSHAERFARRRWRRRAIWSTPRL
jgi:hypothetical protein